MTTPTVPPRGPQHLPFVLVAIFAAVGLALVAAMYIFGAAQHVQAFSGFFLTVFVGLTGFATAVYQFGKQASDLAEIRANTNGTLSAATARESAATARAQALEAQLLQAGHTPVTAPQPTPAAS